MIELQRVILLSAGLLLISIGLIAQSIVPVPSAAVVENVEFNLANEVYIYFENPGPDSMRLRWKRLEYNKPESWTVDLCDYGYCYIGVPTTGTMNPIADPEMPYLKLIVQPGQTAGSAIYKFRVYLLPEESTYVDVTFTLMSDVSNFSSPEFHIHPIKIYPNPVKYQLFIEWDQKSSDNITMYDFEGRSIPVAIERTGSGFLMDVQHLQTGPYVLKIGTRSIQVIKTD